MAVVQILRGGFIAHDFMSCYILLFCWAVSNLGTLAFYKMKLIPHVCMNNKCLLLFPTSLCPPPGIFQLCPSQQCSHGGWWLCSLPYLRGKTCGPFSQTELLPAGKRLLKIWLQPVTPLSQREYWYCSIFRIQPDSPEKNLLPFTFNLLASLSPAHIPHNHFYLTINSVALH